MKLFCTLASMIGTMIVLSIYGCALGVAVLLLVAVYKAVIG